ncbi:MAG: YlmH/Sll1252 family protein [Aerococcus sp.]|nr:YlmH/Sll1252 family protein [Aerococcus sp.]
MSEAIFQHFGTEERAFIEKVLDWQTRVVERYQLVLTPFLNPREQYIVRSIVGDTDDFQLASFGGFEGAERQRILFIPPYVEETTTDFEVSILSIAYAEKFSSLRHGQVLGSLLGQGLQRNRIGDIIYQQDQAGNWQWQIAVDQKQLAFLIQMVTHIGRTPVTLQERPLAEALPVPDNWQHHASTVSSFRLDVIVSEAFHLSRGRVKELINGGAVTINWAETKSLAATVNEYDIISVRRHGRIRLDAKGKPTARGNYHIQYSVIKSQ